MGFWDRYDHPRNQSVPIDRMAVVVLVLAAASVIASPICLGPSIALAAIFVGHRVRRRLNPYDAAGIRMTRRALWMAYSIFIAAVITYAAVGLILLAVITSRSILVAVLLVGALTFVLLAAAVAAAAIAFADRSAERAPSSLP